MKVALRFSSIEESIFARMTRLAGEKQALNLAQGFPDFNGPQILIDRINYHLNSCSNQYTRSYGHPILCEAINQYTHNTLLRDYCPKEEITIVNGATEGILCTIMGLVNPGKKILVIEPYYESYLACALMAGAYLRGVPLIAPSSESEIASGTWRIDWQVFDRELDKDVGLILLNHPHNPSGKVFNQEELNIILSSAKKFDIPIAIDGVYENLVYAPNNHNFVRFPKEYSENIIFISSISKTLSFTGFKIGWVLAPKNYMRGIRAVHEAAVFCQPPHLQLAVADVLSDSEFLSSYLDDFRQSFLTKRDQMREILSDFGFMVPLAQGSYFLMAKKNRAPLKALKDNDMSLEMLERYKIATIPVSGFFCGKAALQDWLRFAFCKKAETIGKLSKALREPIA